MKSSQCVKNIGCFFALFKKTLRHGVANKEDVCWVIGAESQDLIDLGNRIRKRRQEIHLSQEVLAEKTGISPNTISRIEGGQTAMSIEIFRKLAVILKPMQDTYWECKEEENHRLYDLICRAKN